jgi:hypothetical protein
MDIMNVWLTEQHQNTQSTIKETAEKLKENCKSAMTITASKITQIRVYTVEKMEKILTLGIEH